MKLNNNWVKYSVSVSEEFVEPVVQMFSKFLQGGVVVEKLGDPEDKAQSKESVVSGFVLHDFANNDLENNLKAGLSLFSGVFEISDLGVDEISSDVWEKQKFDPIIIDDVAILPSREEIKRFKNNIWVIIEPSMAFGTGHHPTTKMCISIIKKYLFEGSRIVDIGCGSGILGIVALKLGATHCLSIDVEEESVKASIKNAEDSEVNNLITVERQDLLKSLNISDNPDIIIANLNSFLFREGLEHISKFISPEKIIIASGILINNLNEIEEIFYLNKFNIIDRHQSGDWAAIVARKK